MFLEYGGGTRRVRLVRKEGRDVSSQYGREGGGGPLFLGQRLPGGTMKCASPRASGGAPAPKGPKVNVREDQAPRFWSSSSNVSLSRWECGEEDVSNDTGQKPMLSDGAAPRERDKFSDIGQNHTHTHTPPSRTDWTRLVPPPVLTGHVHLVREGDVVQQSEQRAGLEGAAAPALLRCDLSAVATAHPPVWEQVPRRDPPAPARGHLVRQGPPPLSY